jgi:hypothetical protein
VNLNRFVLVRTSAIVTRLITLAAPHAHNKTQTP